MKSCLLIFLIVFFTISINSQTKFYSVFASLRVNGKPIHCDRTDIVQKRILFEYGAVYVSKGATLPPKCRFVNEAEVARFVKSFRIAANKFAFGDFFLQPKAKKALEQVFLDLGGYINVARNCNPRTLCTINSSINDDWSLRSYEQTQCNWLDLGNDLAECKKQIPAWQDDVQLAELETNGTELPKMFRVAVPGGSQHHLGLAIDVNNKEYKENGEKNDRFCGLKCEIALGQNGWYRTIPFDEYHFTYLGYLEFELPDKGLKKVLCKDKKSYWIPRVTAQAYEESYSFIKNPDTGCQDVE